MGQQCSGGSHAAEDVFTVPEAAFSITVRTTEKMGWKPDLPDFRDRVLSLPRTKTRGLPRCVDLRPDERQFRIYQQGKLGSCTANAIGAAFHFSLARQGVAMDFEPSRLFIYYNERSMEGTVDKDSGAMIRDGLKSLHKIGVCSETMWPYIEEEFKTRPSEACYEAAVNERAQEYARVPHTLEDMKACINEGYPFVFGFAVFSSFMTKEVATTGKMVMPSIFDQFLGGHAVMAIGYDDSTRTFVIRNSWGPEWGDRGYFYMPYDFISHSSLVADLWTLRFVQSTGRDFPTKALF